jgi:hypothetical protein
VGLAVISEIDKFSKTVLKNTDNGMIAVAMTFGKTTLRV